MLFVYIVLLGFNLILGILPLILGKRKMGDITFSILVFGLTLWILANFAAEFIPKEDIYVSMLTLSSRFAIVGAMVTAISLVYFVRNYPIELEPLSKVKTVFVWLLPVICLLSAPTSLMFQNATIIGGNLVRHPGPLFPLFLLYSFSYIGHSVYMIFKGISNYSGLDKLKLKYIAIGLLLMIGSIIVCYGIVWQLLGIQKYLSFGPLSATFFIGFTSYSILKHRLLDLSLIISKSAAFVLAIIILSTTYYTLVWLYQTFVSQDFNTIFLLLTVVFWLGMGMGFQSLRIFLQSTADRVFLKGRYDYKKVLRKFTEDLSTCGNFEDLTKTVIQNFNDEIEVPVSIYFPENYEAKHAISDQYEKWEWQDDELKIVTDNNIETNGTLMKGISELRDVIITSDANPDVKAELKKRKVEALVPCFNNGDTVCLLMLGKKMTQDAYNDDDVALFNTISTQIPTAVRRINQARVSAEYDVAQAIQTEIVPKEPKVPGLELACFMRPADEVGGDYYDVHNFDGYSWILLGDATGHGLGAGLVMFMIQSIMSSIIHTKTDISPKELNYLANIILTQNMERLDEKRTMTIASICYTGDGNFKVSGSHDDLMIYRHKDKSVESFQLQHFPLGLGLTAQFPLDSFEEGSFSLDKGDVLFIITDGITEAWENAGKSQEMFGEERLRTFIKDHATLPATEIREKLMETLDAFTKGVYQDDVTFIVAKR
ncbi:MAG: SpoIIE family protein phosphatase [Candidatus Margulisbacteria bacterium]|nr:SpoIIE family protein phosphatase [Candidatus Margulisiibacteriota bacterium]